MSRTPTNLTLSRAARGKAKKLAILYSKRDGRRASVSALVERLVLAEDARLHPQEAAGK